MFVTYMPFMLFTLALFPSLLSYKPAVCHTSLNDSNEYVCLRHLIKLHRQCIWARIERSEVTGLLYDVMLVVNVVLVMCFRRTGELPLNFISWNSSKVGIFPINCPLLHHLNWIWWTTQKEGFPKITAQKKFTNTRGKTMNYHIIQIPIFLCHECVFASHFFCRCHSNDFSFAIFSLFSTFSVLLCVCMCL